MPDQDIRHTSKKCPYCSEHLTLDARICSSCKKKVGKADFHGMAKKTIDWWAYTLAILSWIALCVYIWWAFFREK